MDKRFGNLWSRTRCDTTMTSAHRRGGQKARSPGLPLKGPDLRCHWRPENAAFSGNFLDRLLLPLKAGDGW